MCKGERLRSWHFPQSAGLNKWRVVSSVSTDADRKPTRNELAQRNRGAIARAALEVFTERGFAAARMEDVARRAGVAKGTIYLHFANKEALFEAIVRETILPALDGLTGTEPEPDETTRAFAERLLLGVVSRLQAGSGFAVIRLLMAEGTRFPDLAAIYYRTIVAPGLVDAAPARSTGPWRAANRAARILASFPQLAIAPVLMGLLWEGLFESFEALDVEALVRAYLDLLFRVPPAGSRSA